MYNKEVLEAIRKCSELLHKAIKEYFVNLKIDKVELDNCEFLSYTIEGDRDELWVTSVFLKDNDVWVEYDSDMGGTNTCPLSCFDVTQLYAIYEAM
jgi:hypothetical protein